MVQTIGSKLRPKLNFFEIALKKNSRNIRELYNPVMRELKVVIGIQHTGLLGLWKILMSFFV